MSTIKRPFRRSLYMLLILPSLLLQAQPVYACQMTGTSGPATECCCGEKASAPDSNHQDGCCDFSLELSLKAAADEFPPALLPAQPDYQPAAVPVAWYSHEVLRPDTAKRRHPVYFAGSAGPGTQTYLSTLRLRL